MKAIILMTSLLGFFTIPSFSQNACKLKLDTTLTDLSSFSDLSDLSLTNQNFNIESFKLPDFNKEMKTPSLTSKQISDFKIPTSSIEIQTQFDNMPCLKPNIHTQMPIWEPDTTVMYSILIKEIK